MPGRTDDDYRYRPQPAPVRGGRNRPEPAPGSGGVVTIGGGIDDVRRPPEFGGSIGQPPQALYEHLTSVIAMVT